MPDGTLPKRRNSLRYPGYDYSQPGCIFVTLCTHQRQTLFGRIIDSEMLISPVGEHARDLWYRLPEQYEGVIVDTFVIMPDHIHAIVFLGANPNVQSNDPSLSDIIKLYKVTMHAAYGANVKEERWRSYKTHLWQRGFHDRIRATGNRQGD